MAQVGFAAGAGISLKRCHRFSRCEQYAFKLLILGIRLFVRRWKEDADAAKGWCVKTTVAGINRDHPRPAPSYPPSAGADVVVVRLYKETIQSLFT